LYDVDVAANIEEMRGKVKSANERRPWGPTLANGALAKDAEWSGTMEKNGTSLHTPTKLKCASQKIVL
jgi:hypothetical protein